MTVDHLRCRRCEATAVVRHPRKRQDARELRQVLIDAIKRDGQQESAIAEYEMDIRYSGESEVLATFAATAR